MKTFISQVHFIYLFIFNLYSCLTSQTLKTLTSGVIRGPSTKQAQFPITNSVLRIHVYLDVISFTWRGGGIIT